MRLVRLGAAMWKKCFASRTHVQHAAFAHPFVSKDTLPMSWLVNAAPCFAVHSHNIRILHAPADFYNALMQCCKTVRRRLTLASLYVGNSELESQLITAILENAQFAHLHINVLLDYSRASRCANNSRQMLRPLLAKTKNCTLSLYHTPMLRGVCKQLLPKRWNELLGVQHMKLYIFDDTLIISGANLSNDYFSNRIDRYYVIKDQSLCDFFDGLVKHVQNFSIRIQPDGTEVFGPLGSPYTGSQLDFVRKAGDAIQTYLQQTKVERNTQISKNCDTWIFPLVQMGQLGCEQDRHVTRTLFGNAPPDSKLHIATAYFNLTTQYVNALIFDSCADCHLLVAHPKANGFLGAKGMAGGIPGGYTLLARRFYEKLHKHRQAKRIRLWEYLREGWTYHAKGLWYYAPGSSLPCLTLIGSSNFGNRSVLKDLETQIAVVTENPRLQQQLHDECNGLYTSAINGDFHTNIPYWVYAMVFLFKNYF